MGSADDNSVRGLAYLMVAGLCLAAWQRDDRQTAGYWQVFGPATASFFTALAVGRATDIANVLADLVRDEARTDGWYDGRRRWQAGVIAAIGVAWAGVVLFACIHIPERRRRYLPMTLAVLTVGAFVAVRGVSLHHIDSVLHGQQMVGLQFGTAIEYGLLVATGACAVWSVRRTRRQ